ncbi:Peptidase A1 domain-containing protein [Fusarium sp. LHS14.1]|nr:Peptidase A1 domain-containing protein [Fusarium sp. LHS14.1]
MAWTFSTALVAFILAASAERVPREIKWADGTIGPDGPWRAVSVQMDGDTNNIGLFPGGNWETWIIEDDYCDEGTCYASKAGTYDEAAGTSGGIALDGGLDAYMLGLQLEGEPSIRYLDDMVLGGIRETNVSLALLKDQRIKYPGGQKVPFFAGCLSMGGNKAINQSFTPMSGPAINGSLPPGWMFENAWTPSNSFGMHIGSVQPSMSGSLWFGGYDQNRIVGEILSMSGGPRDGITLWDVGIEVIGNKSPFDFKSKDDLLAKGNSSIGSGLKVLVDGCSPYLSLPKSTCDNIAAELPVNYDESLGLYLWDTKSDKYEEIVSSASALVFSFISGSNTDAVKINVPFMHLNLTLTAPLVDTPTPYFPCHVNGKGQYVLGRAFLQDAFIGANWHKDANTWWLAQAPGRTIQATNNIISIEEKDKTISKGGNDWKASWSGVWDDEGVPASTPTPKPTTTKEPANTTPEDEGLSTGAKAGIGVGIAAGVLAMTGLGFFFWRRRRQQTPPPEASQVAYTPASEAAYSVNAAKWPPSELPHERPPQEIQGTPVTQPRYELA